MNLRNILFDNKLTGSNFMDCVQNLRIILRQEKLLYVLENPIPSEPAPDDDVAVKDAYQKHSDDYESVCCLMLASMSPDLQKQHEDMNAFTMLNHLKALYDKRARNERSTELLSLIHTDVCGPMSTQARNGFSYFLTFTDDHSRYGHVYLLKYKSEVFEKFKEYKSEVENQLGKSIKVLRSNRGGEYLS